MKYYVYIDETGNFKKDSNSSVGAFISYYNPKQVIEKLEKSVSNFNKKHKVNFNSKDIHIAPMLHPDSPGVKLEEAYLWRNIPQSLREEYATHLQKLLDQELAVSYIKSENKSFQLGKEDSQTRYGQCLYALIHKLTEIKNSLKNCTSFHVIIATRDESCLPTSANWRPYHEGLCQYINSWFELGSITHSYRQIKKAMNMADVACYFLRNQFDKCTNAHITQPNANINKQYADDKTTLIKALLDENMYYAAYNIADNKDAKTHILQKIDNNTPETELKQFIEQAKYLIETRTNNDNSIQEAVHIITHCIKVSNEAILTKAYSLKIAIINHQGKIKGQGTIISDYQKALKKLNIAYFTRQDLSLELRNRALNQQFNSFNFDKIIDEFEQEVKVRNQQLNSNKCSLQGKCQSTLGQAYAFYAAVENEIELWQESKIYFKQALDHFEEDEKNHAQTSHYLEVGQWYFRQKKQTLGKKDDVWNLLNRIRIFADTDNPKNQIIKQAKSFLAQAKKYNQSEHPMSLIYKWIGILYLKTDCFVKARDTFNSAYLKNKGKTLDIINLNIKALEILSLKLNNVNKQSDNLMHEFNEELDTLSTIASGFRQFLTEKRKKQWSDDLTNHDIDAIAKWLPFTYA